MKAAQLRYLLDAAAGWRHLRGNCKRQLCKRDNGWAGGCGCGGGRSKERRVGQQAAGLCFRLEAGRKCPRNLLLANLCILSLVACCRCLIFLADSPLSRGKKPWLAALWRPYKASDSEQPGQLYYHFRCSSSQSCSRSAFSIEQTNSSVWQKSVAIRLSAELIITIINYNFIAKRKRERESKTV